MSPPPWPEVGGLIQILCSSATAACSSHSSSFMLRCRVRLLWSGAQYNYSIFKEKDHTKCSSFFSSERVTQGWGEWASLIHLGASLLYCLLCYVSVKGICGCLDGRSSSTANISTTKKEKNNDISLNKVWYARTHTFSQYGMIMLCLHFLVVVMFMFWAVCYIWVTILNYTLWRGIVLCSCSRTVYQLKHIFLVV